MIPYCLKRGGECSSPQDCMTLGRCAKPAREYDIDGFRVPPERDETFRQQTKSERIARLRKRWKDGDQDAVLGILDLLEDEL